MDEGLTHVGRTNCIAVIVAGGQGSRYGSDVPKQLVTLAGYPILHHTLRRFEQAAPVSRVVVVANPDWQCEIAEIASYVLRRTPHQVVAGGNSRNASIGCAVRALDDAADDSSVLIHDGVRPFTTEDVIRRVLKSLESYRAVIPVIPSADPLLRISGPRVIEFEQRAQVVRGQSPQGFILKDLRSAFKGEQDAGRFDTLFELLLSIEPGLVIGHVEGEMNNIKITTPIDRAIAGQIIIEAGP